MANDLTTNGPATAIRSSNATTALASSIPSWVSLRSLDASFEGYGLPIPPDQASALREAAAGHQLAQQPATAGDRHAVLFGLRSATILRREDADEAEATLVMLRVHLADVPLDILKTACNAYCNAPGRRFFPRSAGELRTFINPLMRERQNRVFLLRRLADQAEAQDAERERLAADPPTPEGIAAIKAEFGLDRAGEPRRARAMPRLVPEVTAADYIAIGLSPADAKQAVRDRARMLARGTARGITAAVGVIGSARDAIAAE